MAYFRLRDLRKQLALDDAVLEKGLCGKVQPEVALKVEAEELLTFPSCRVEVGPKCNV